MRTYVVAYDIRDARRWRRVYACLKRRGVRLQYSVFLVRSGKVGMDRILAQLSDVIDPRRDDVRIYPVPAAAEWTWIGGGPLPEAVHLIDGGGRELPGNGKGRFDEMSKRGRLTRTTAENLSTHLPSDCKQRRIRAME